MRPNRLSGAHQRGTLAGGEVLPLGFLLLVMAMLVITNAWAVLDARLAASAASREATRTAVETADDPRAAGVRAGQASLAASGMADRPHTIEITAPRGFARCSPIVATVRHTIPAFRVPWVGGIGSVTVTARHHGVVDPHRDGVPEGSCP